MHYTEFAERLLFGESLDDKLSPPIAVTYEIKDSSFLLPNAPGRSTHLQFDKRQIKFPKKSSFHLDDRRGLAIHFFANHELLAIEMMAAALLQFPIQNDEDVLVKKGIVKTLVDEQKHLKLYLDRLVEFKLELGAYPLNDFFWRQMPYLTTPQKFYSLMALTFESANLDFALYYESVFKEVDDHKSAQIMKTVYDDELSHVALGAHWLNIWRRDKSLWEYFCENLPPLLTPARSKGIHFNKEARVRSGLDEQFISHLANYEDSFGITNRKNW